MVPRALPGPRIGVAAADGGPCRAGEPTLPGVAMPVAGSKGTALADFATIKTGVGGCRRHLGAGCRAAPIGPCHGACAGGGHGVAADSAAGLRSGEAGHVAGGGRWSDHRARRSVRIARPQRVARGASMTVKPAFSKARMVVELSGCGSMPTAGTPRRKNWSTCGLTSRGP